MRWSYKTVHYSLKKEGFLGSAFLDEAEVEQSLNEYGRAGWELISVTETQDGLIAIFKQPIDRPENGFLVGDIIEDDEEKPEETEELITERDIIEETDDASSADDDIYTIRIE